MNYKVLYKAGNLHWVIVSNVINKSFKLNKYVVLTLSNYKTAWIQTSELGNNVLSNIT